jgi:hypothetical protein
VTSSLRKVRVDGDSQRINRLTVKAALLQIEQQSPSLKWQGCQVEK